MRISDWSSDVCSSDLRSAALLGNRRPAPNSHVHVFQTPAPIPCGCLRCSPCFTARCRTRPAHPCATCLLLRFIRQRQRSEEHTSELQSLMRISYAVFCLKKKKKNHT